MFLLWLKLALVVAVVATAATDGDNNNTSSRVLSRKHSLPEKKTRARTFHICAQIQCDYVL